MMWKCSPAWNPQCWYLHMLLLIVYLHHPKINICSCGTVDLGTEKIKREVHTPNGKLWLCIWNCVQVTSEGLTTRWVCLDQRFSPLMCHFTYKSLWSSCFLGFSRSESLENNIFPESDSEPGSCFLFISFTVVVFQWCVWVLALFENKFWLSQPLSYYCYLGGNRFQDLV